MAEPKGNGGYPEELDVSKMSVEEMQKEVLKVELQQKLLLLNKTRKEMVDYEAAEARRHEQNRRRMAELKSERDSYERIQKACRHRSGGSPNNILKGKGVGSFSILSRAVMPDGKTVLIQCPRCRLKLYPPQESLKRGSKEQKVQYITEMRSYNKLLEQATEEGLEFAVMRGPTFMFERDGVPFIPDRV